MKVHSAAQLERKNFRLLSFLSILIPGKKKKRWNEIRRNIVSLALNEWILYMVCSTYYAMRLVKLWLVRTLIFIHSLWFFRFLACLEHLVRLPQKRLWLIWFLNFQYGSVRAIVGGKKGEEGRYEAAAERKGVEIPSVGSLLLYWKAANDRVNGERCGRDRLELRKIGKVLSAFSLCGEKIEVHMF